MNDKFEIRDRRKTRWFWCDKQILEAKIFPSTKLVYFTLCSYANETTQKAWPNIDTISDNAGTSRSSVIRALERLVKSKLIKRDLNKGRHNVYTLLPVTSVKMTLLHQCHGRHGTSVIHDTTPVSLVTPKHTNEHTKETEKLIKKIRETHNFLNK